MCSTRKIRSFRHDVNTPTSMLVSCLGKCFWRLIQSTATCCCGELLTFTITLHSRYCYVKLFEWNFNRRHEAVLQSQLDVSQHIEYNIDTEIHRLSQELCVCVCLCLLLGQIYLSWKSGPAEVKHWKDMLSRPRTNVAQWHALKAWSPVHGPALTP